MNQNPFKRQPGSKNLKSVRSRTSTKCGNFHKIRGSPVFETCTCKKFLHTLHPKHKEERKCFWETWLLNLQLSLLLIIFEDLFLFIYVDMYMCAYVCKYLFWSEEEALESPKARVTGGCEPSNMCAKTQIL